MKERLAVWAFKVFGESAVVEAFITKGYINSKRMNLNPYQWQDTTFLKGFCICFLCCNILKTTWPVFWITEIWFLSMLLFLKDTEIDILVTIQNLLEHCLEPTSFLKPLAKLFSVIKNKLSRQLLCTVFQVCNTHFYPKSLLFQKITMTWNVY